MMRHTPLVSTASRRLGCRTGQAILELAIFGAVALAALGFLLKVGMKMNHDQEIRMAAFRRALAAAASDNGTDEDAMGTTFHYIVNRQLPDSSDNLMAPARERSEASAFVEWGDRLTFAHEIDRNGDGYADNGLGYKTQMPVIVRSDGTERVFRQDDFPDDGTNGVAVNFAQRGIVHQGQATNTSSGTISSSGGGSSLGSSVSTSSSTLIRTRNGDTIGSSVSSGTGVGW